MPASTEKAWRGRAAMPLDPTSCGQYDDGTPVIWVMSGTHLLFSGVAGSFNPGQDWHVIASPSPPRTLFVVQGRSKSDRPLRTPH